MNERHGPRPTPPITFAVGGAAAHGPADSLEALALGLRLGATGLASTVWLSADAVPVLHRTGLVGRRLRRAPIGSLSSAALEPGIATLDQLYSRLGSGFELSLELGDPEAIEAVIEVADRHQSDSGDGAGSRLWLCHNDWRRLAPWRPSDETVALVNITRLVEMNQGPERRAAQLSEAGITAVNMPYPDWSAGLVVLFARFGLLAFARDAPHERMLDDLFAMGVDAVYGGHLDRMTSAMSRAGW